jgi:YidC/Oxa1 family membrane protein insertase
LYAKQIKSTANMSSVQPKMQEIQRKYANDREMMNAKMAELYKEENVNPASGCLPMIVQMIVIFGLFALLRNPIQYLGSSSDMLFAVHSSFLWIADLAQPDKWILPIGAGIATYFSFSMSQSNGAMGASGAPGMGGAEGMMKSMKYIFPVMIVLMARSYPAGLAIYWFFSQVIQIFFNLRFRKIREEIKGEKKSRKKGKK